MNHRVAAAYAEMKKAQSNPDGTPKDTAKQSAPDTLDTVIPKYADHRHPHFFGARDPFFRRTFQ